MIPAIFYKVYIFKIESSNRHLNLHREYKYIKTYRCIHAVENKYSLIVTGFEGWGGQVCLEKPECDNKKNNE